MLLDFFMKVEAAIKPWIPFGKEWLWVISIFAGIMIIGCLLLIIQSIIDRIIDHFID